MAKTDAIDARIITRFAENKTPRVCELPSKNRRQRAALVDRRQHIIEIKTAETNRLETAIEPTHRERIQEHLDFISTQLDQIGKDVDGLIEENANMKEKSSSE